MKRIGTFLTLCTVFIVLSCNQSGMAILHSIVEEQELAESTLGDDLTVSHMVGLGGDYYLAAASLYKGVLAAGDITWTEQDGPTGAAPYTICLSIADLGGELYGLFSTIDGSDAAVFHDTGSGWESVYDPSSGEPSHMVTAGGQMFVSVRQGISYTTVESSDAVSFTDVTLSGQSAAVTDAASFLGDLWLVSGSLLFNDSGGSFAAVTDSDGPTASVLGIGGIFASAPASLDTLFVADKDGVVYALPNGGAWDTTDITDDATDAGNPLSLSDMAEVEIEGSTVVLVGTESGYSELIFDAGYSTDVVQVIPGEAASLTSDANYQNVAMADSAVLTFHVDASAADGPILFAGTGGVGLWRNPIDETSTPVVRKWDPE